MNTSHANRRPRLEPVALEDNVLVARAVDGDNAAFELIIRRHNRLLFRTLRSILGNDADAEDALQEAWITTHRSLATFRAEARLSTWLLRIVINTALMKRRRAARDIVVPLRPLDSMDITEHGALHPAEQREGTDADAQSPEQSQLRAEARRLVESKIDELPDAFRVVFMLRVVEERSVQEIASLLGIPEATVRTRQFRARALLRAALANELDVAADGAFAFDGDRCDRVVAAVFARLHS